MPKSLKVQSKTKSKKTVEALRPVDDIFFHKLVERKEFCEEMLQVILENPKLEVIDNQPQKSLRNVEGRSVSVDVLCKDNHGRYYDVEMQRTKEEDCQRRVRYNGANVDTYITEKGSTFAEIPDVYVIYISTNDAFARGKTIYHIERRVKETEDVVENGFHEVYVNTKINDGSDIAELMKIMKSTDIPASEKFPKISWAIRYYKEGKGRKVMCEVVEEYAKEYAKENTEEIALRLLLAGVDEYIIQKSTRLSSEELRQLKEKCMEPV